MVRHSVSMLAVLCVLSCAARSREIPPLMIRPCEPYPGDEVVMPEGPYLVGTTIDCRISLQSQMIVGAFSYRAGYTEGGVVPPTIYPYGDLYANIHSTMFFDADLLDIDGDPTHTTTMNCPSPKWSDMRMVSDAYLNGTHLCSQSDAGGSYEAYAQWWATFDIDHSWLQSPMHAAFTSELLESNFTVIGEPGGGEEGMGDLTQVILAPDEHS